jgi:hypothetical protein
METKLRGLKGDLILNRVESKTNMSKQEDTSKQLE